MLLLVSLLTIFSHMAFPVKQVRTLEEQLHAIDEVEKKPSEKRADVAKQIGLPPSTQNSIIVKKMEIREQADKCGTSAKSKTGKEPIYSKAGKCLLCLVEAGQSIRNTCGWVHPAGEIPQNSCNNGD
jgi:hypothetical protein